MDFHFDQSRGGQDETPQHADLSVKPGAHENGDSTAGYRSGAFDKKFPSDSTATSEMHTADSARERAVNIKGGHGDAKAPE